MQGKGFPSRTDSGSAPDAFLLLDEFGRIVDVSASACELTALRKEDLVARPLGEFFPLVRSVDLAKAIESMAPDATLVIETEVPGEGGAARPVHLRVSRVASPGRRQAMVRLKDRRRAADRLPQDTEFVRALLGSTGSLVVVVDAQERIALFNAACEGVSGYRFAEVRGKLLSTLLSDPADVQSLRCSLAELRGGRDLVRGTAAWKSRDGRERRLSWRWSTLRDAEGSPLYFIGTGIDLSEAREELAPGDRGGKGPHVEAFFKNAPYPLFIAHASGRYVDVNPAACEVMGYTRDELLERPVFQFSADPAETRGKWERFVGRGAERGEFTLRRKDGSPIETEFFAVTDLHPGYLVSTLRDSAQRRKAEADLRASEERLRLILEQVPLAVWTIDRNYVITSCEGKMYGDGKLMPAEAFLGKSQLELVPGDHVVVAAHRKALMGECATYELSLHGKIYEAHVEPLRRQGEIAGAVGAAFDVTARKRRERAQEVLARATAAFSGARELEEALSAVAAMAASCMADWCVVDLLQADGALRRIAVAHRDRVRTENVRDALCGVRLDPASPTGSPEVLRSGQPVFFERLGDQELESMGQDSRHIRVLREIGAKSGLIVPMRVPGKVLGALLLAWGESGHRADASDLNLAQDLADRVALAIENRLLSRAARDEIEARCRVEEQVRLLNLDLERRVQERTSELESAVGEMTSFTSTVAHDLRSPLRAIHGFSDLLLRDYSSTLDASGREFLHRIAGEAVRMDSLIGDLLAFSRVSREDFVLEGVELEGAILEAIAALQLELESPRVEIRLHPPLPAVRGHRTMVEVVLANLLGNAAKFVRPGVSPRIDIRAEVREDAVRVWVQDNGIGIPPEQHERIFKAFHRLHRTEEYPGTGLGLAIVERAIERMQGRVGVVSEPGMGSRFWFELPPA